MTKAGKKILLTIWAIIALIVVLTWLTPLEFTNNWTASILTVLTTSGLTVTLWLSSTDKDKKIKFMTWTLILIPLTVLTIIAVELLSWGGGFKTQHIFYRNQSNPYNRIEYQMADIGAFGYNTRTVKIIQLTPLLQWTTMVDADKINPNEWIKVDEYVNELELKGG